MSTRNLQTPALNSKPQTLFKPDVNSTDGNQEAGEVKRGDGLKGAAHFLEVVYWGYMGYMGYIGALCGLKRDNGKENGNSYSILGLDKSRTFPWQLARPQTFFKPVHTCLAPFATWAVLKIMPLWL